MRRLSSPVERISASYDVIVIGSGYGGGIAASRLSRAGRRVCLIERGNEIHPGEYPATPLAFAREVQSDLGLVRLGSRSALFDVRYNPDINVVVGCGLGGTSLINAAIALRPDEAVLADAAWPAEIRASRELDPYFEYAEAMLAPNPYPHDGAPLGKLDALDRCARSLRQPFARVPVMINFR